ncbi:MAG: DUF3987 domain-containing protein [Enhydrobacter sp.]|nr:MAG: DUF3987 domain-containing protein [Enhydrobacter sp.]
MPLAEQHAKLLGIAPFAPLDRRLLEGGRPTPAPFPLDFLPPAWRAWARAVARAWVPLDFAAHAALAAASAMVGRNLQVDITTQWAEPLLLWQALVGGPSSGKSAAMTAALRLVDTVRPKADEAAKAKEEDGDPVLFVLGDLDMRRAAALNAASPRGLTLWRDDLVEWLGSAAGDAALRDAWRAAWSGHDATLRHFPGPLPMEIAGFGLGILGGLRPERLPALLDEDGGEDLAACFLYAWPEPAIGGGLDAVPDEDTISRALRRLLHLPPGLLAFSPEARALFESLLPDFRLSMRAADGVEAAWIGKGANTLARLAGLRSVMEWAEGGSTAPPTVIDTPHLEAAWALWMDHLLPNARAAFDGIASERDRLARRAALWLKRQASDDVSREAIRREALSERVNAERTDDIIVRLEKAGVLRRVPMPERDGNKGRPPLRWQVNPELSR